MRNVITLQDLLTALYDSMLAARATPRSESHDAPAPRAVERARRILQAAGAASHISATAYDISEMKMRFDCELYQRNGKTGLQMRRTRWWRNPPSLPVEIRLYGSQPLKTDVLIGGHLLKTIAGRPLGKAGG
ncbi:hypothetical protein [Amantichitinum ursilacus]|uniref:Uncharacterized protein n=1 Tax=Amantichitinum ursilacus TaxID=857265 RepID=A0A0N0XIQ0_9NEIS|nr:hypothetical protein [Amantichitinum ursilacus]KPC52579.1 hypothetical protein WG78_12065 [Amantichitinum ursilacus]